MKLPSNATHGQNKTAPIASVHESDPIAASPFNADSINTVSH